MIEEKQHTERLFYVLLSITSSTMLFPREIAFLCLLLREKISSRRNDIKYHKISYPLIDLKNQITLNRNLDK